MASRELKIASLFHSNIAHMRDGGRAKEPGTVTTSRGQISAMLDKKVVIDGKKFPVFLLAEVPDVFDADDEFDEKELKDRSGKWNLPYPEWEAIRAKNIADREVRFNDAKAQARQRIAGNIADSLAHLVNMQPAPAPEPRDPGAAAGEAAFAKAKAEGKTDEEAGVAARAAQKKARGTT